MGVAEAAFVSSALLREGIFPVLMKQRAAVVMATTPSEKPTSLFMELIRHVDEKGNTRMYVVRSGQPCKSCMKGSEPWYVSLFFSSFLPLYTHFSPYKQDVSSYFG